MGTTIPASLYGLYQVKFALTPLLITLVYAAYSIGVVPTLFLFGPLGDILGRKRLLIIAAVTAIIGTGEYFIAPTFTVYILELIILLLILIFLITIKGTATLPVSNSFHIMRPTLPSLKLSFLTASLASALVLAMSGLYFSLAPTYAENILQIHNMALGGIVPAVMIFASIITQYLMSEKSPVKLESIGLIALMIGLLLLLAAKASSSLIILLTASVNSGIGFGSTFLGAVNVVNRIAPPERRGSVTSLFYAISYSALGIPIIGIGLATQYSNLFNAVQEFIFILIIIAIIDIPLIQLQYHDLKKK
jgi:MFS family permease